MVGDMVEQPAKQCAGGRRFLESLRVSYLLQGIAITLLLLIVPIGATTASAQKSSGPSAHVYFLRGVLNIFSLGLDDIAAKLQQQGIPSTVANYLLWSSLADQAAAEYKSKRAQTIILVGHSSGATTLPDMVNRLNQLGVPVALVIGLDSIFQTRLEGRVGRYINFYVANGAGTRVERTAQTRGDIENVDVGSVPGVGHLTIDKNEIMQRRVIAAINATVRRGPRETSAAPRP
jgi:hypothetical protein